ncbi:head decoration protein [Vreelandella sp. EE7]
MPGMTQASHHPRQLVGGEFPIRFTTVLVAEGPALVAGSVLGEVTADEMYALSAATAEDGSQVPSVVLWEDVDATEGPVPAEVMLTGDLRAAALTLGEGHTVESVRKALRRWSLFVL